MSQNQNITLVNNRSHLNARSSIQAIINYARTQDNKIHNSRGRTARAILLTRFLIVLPPVLYLSWHFTMGYWRSIYPTSFLSGFVDSTQQRFRQYFVPEIYLKEREKRKIEIKLKQTEQLRSVWLKQ